MPMPTYVNERPVKTGCWTEREDELLAEWQGKYGNRFAHATCLLKLWALPMYSIHTALPLCQAQYARCVSGAAGGAWWPKRFQAEQDSSVRSGGVTRCRLCHSCKHRLCRILWHTSAALDGHVVSATVLLT